MNKRDNQTRPNLFTFVFSFEIFSLSLDGGSHVVEELSVFVKRKQGGRQELHGCCLTVKGQFENCVALALGGGAQETSDSRDVRMILCDLSVDSRNQVTAVGFGNLDFNAEDFICQQYSHHLAFIVLAFLSSAVHAQVDLVKTTLQGLCIGKFRVPSFDGTSFVDHELSLSHPGVITNKRLKQSLRNVEEGLAHDHGSEESHQVWLDKFSKSEEFFKFLARKFRVQAGVVGGINSTSTGELYLLKNG